VGVLIVKEVFEISWKNSVRRSGFFHGKSWSASQVLLQDDIFARKL